MKHQVITFSIVLLIWLFGLDIEKCSFSQLSEDCTQIKGQVLNQIGEPLKVLDAVLLKKVLSLLNPKPHYELELDGGFAYLGDGYFMVEICYNCNTYVLEIKAAGFVPKRIENIMVTPGSIIELGKITLSDLSGYITGQVVEADDNTPIYWIEAEAINKDNEEYSDVDWTDHTGYFSFPNLFPGEYKVQIFDISGDYYCAETEFLTISPGEKIILPSFKMKKMSLADKVDMEKQKKEAMAMCLHIPSLKFYIGDGEGADDIFNINLTIGTIESGSPIEKAGLQNGDVIIKINDNYLNLINRQSVAFKDLFGKPGSKVKLTILRKDSEKEEDVEVIIEDWDYHETWEYFEGE